MTQINMVRALLISPYMQTVCEVFATPDLEGMRWNTRYPKTNTKDSLPIQKTHCKADSSVNGEHVGHSREAARRILPHLKMWSRNISGTISRKISELGGRPLHPSTPRGRTRA